MSTTQRLKDEIGHLQKKLADRNTTIDNQRSEIVAMQKENQKLRDEIQELKQVLPK